MKPERHIFVCTNQRPADNPKGSCADRGSKEVFSAFRAAVEARGLRGRVQVSQSGCLKPCAYGPTVVVYPEGTWYGKVGPQDVESILDAHAEGRRLESLELPEEAL